MIRLVEFLEARLAEDEAIARSVEPLGHTDALGGIRIDHAFSVARLVASGEDGSYRREGDKAAAAHFRRHDPARVLREVEAKRRLLLGDTAATLGWADTVAASEWNSTQDAYGDFLKLLAAPYSDHPDFRSEWLMDEDGTDD